MYSDDSIAAAPVAGQHPAITGPDTASTLSQALQQVIRAVTGLAGQYVRPRWQPDPPLRPGRDVNWCGFGTLNMMPDANPYYGADGELVRYESGELAVSFYGPNCQTLAGVLRDGLMIPDNRVQLRGQGLTIDGAGATLHVPELINDVWYERADVTFEISVEVRRTYVIQSIVSASGIIYGHGPDPAIQVPFRSP